MIPCSSKSQILELLLFLETLFQTNARFQPVAGDFAVLYLEHLAAETLDVAKSHTSWMDFKDNSLFQDIAKVPFTFSFVKSISSLEEYHQNAYGSGSRLKPLVVVTSMSSLQTGFSSQILREFAARDSNEIVLIEKPLKGDSVAAKVFNNQKRFYLQETTYTYKPIERQVSTHSHKQSIEEVIAEIKH